MIRWKRMLCSIMAILIAASLTSPSYTFAESLSSYGASANFAGTAGRAAGAVETTGEAEEETREETQAETEGDAMDRTSEEVGAAGIAEEDGTSRDPDSEEAVWEDAAELRTIRADVARAALYEEEEPTAVYAYVDRFLHALYDRDVQPKEKPGRTVPLTVEVTGVLPADVTAAAEIIEFEDEPEDGNESFRERTLFYINLALYDGEGTVYIPCRGVGRGCGLRTPPTPTTCATSILRAR